MRQIRLAGMLKVRLGNSDDVATPRSAGPGVPSHQGWRELMKLRHPILSILSIIVLVGASIAGPATSASAGTDRWTSTTDSTPTGGVAIFDADSADGEILYVCD